MISEAIAEPSQVGSIRRAAIRFAQDAGFPQDVLDRIGIVVTEAGTNLLRHSAGGRIFVAEAYPAGRRTLQVTAVDSGPGIASVEKALRDGYSTRAGEGGGMGTGLGAIKRQSDAFDIYSDGDGTTLVSTFLANPRDRVPAHDLAGLIVPKPGFSTGGDAWAARPIAGGHLVMLVDVLGHGPKAQEEAQKAIAGFLACPDDRLEAVEVAVSQALAGDRGAAVLIAEVKAAGTPMRAVGLGNIKGEIIIGTERKGIPSAPGISGSSTRRPQPTSHDWPQGAVLLLSTDGLKSTIRHAEPPALLHRDALTIAATIYQRRRRDTDDCEVVVLKG